MCITREKLLKHGVIAATIIICIAIVGLILNGINHFKVGSQLAGINQVSNLSHLLVRQQANLFSLMLVKNTKNDELVEALDLFSKEEFVIDATIYSASGSLMAQSSNALAFKPLEYSTIESDLATQQIVEPIFTKDDLIGFLRVTFNAEYGQTTQSKINELFHLLYGELIILFLAGGLFISCFYYYVHKTPHIINSLPKLVLSSEKRQSQRFHSRRRAFQRK
ncbi:hemolysin regulation protein AhpA [Pasteurellaceae bacterium 15-036681]|nr:hemolysin regulation protein AhpA [Pasteurellaceae bacterium 15-036681]